MNENAILSDMSRASRKQNLVKGLRLRLRSPLRAQGIKGKFRTDLVAVQYV